MHNGVIKSRCPHGGPLRNSIVLLMPDLKLLLENKEDQILEFSFREIWLSSFRDLYSCFRIFSRKRKHHCQQNRCLTFGRKRRTMEYCLVKVADLAMYVFVYILVNFKGEHPPLFSYTSYVNPHLFLIFNFSGMVAPQLKKNRFTGDHAFKYHIS